MKMYKIFSVIIYYKYLPLLNVQKYVSLAEYN